MKRILVQCGQNQIEVAVMENDRLVEYDSEFRGAEHLAGNMYIGRVVNVLQGMQAAFLDIGLEKNAFLYIDDILPAHLEKIPKQKPLITDLVAVGQELLVQVVKEPVGTKGARITTHYSIPGRWGVYMPCADYVGVSRKIENESERERLKQAAERQLRPGEGFIARTAAEGISEEMITADLEELRRRWQVVDDLCAQEGVVPRKVYTDFGLLPRWIRDVFRDDVGELWVNDKEAHVSIITHIHQGSPGLRERAKLFDGQTGTLFNRYHASSQLENSFKRKIWLDNGGYIVVDHTEALTVFDVNTGRYTGSIDLEQTAKDTNLLAAKEISRLLRLRDIGGLIIIDFIDMVMPIHRQLVLETLETEAKRDRTKTVIEGWTRLGLVEMTRKKVRDGKDKMMMRRCTVCDGSGWIGSK